MTTLEDNMTKLQVILTDLVEKTHYPDSPFSERIVLLKQST